MVAAPADPKIYHITHWRNLPRIIEAGVLWSDAERIRQSLDCEVVGMAEIKRRRLEDLPVWCHPDTRVGEYVPFYFCPRSIMLYLLHLGNHRDVTYREGQGPIVHLVSDLRATVSWAESNRRRWAFSDRNAGAHYTSFFSSLDDLHKVNWIAVAANDFRVPTVKEGKQAEFLMHQAFPWTLVERIGVQNDDVAAQVAPLLSEGAHKPLVAVERSWYF